MAEQIFIGSNLSFQLLSDYIFEHKINRSDSIVLNALNYEHLIEEIRSSPEHSVDIPVNIFGVLLIKDTTLSVDIGKIQIIKNEPF